jgi:predicted small integral membrane protein
MKSQTFFTLVVLLLLVAGVWGVARFSGTIRQAIEHVMTERIGYPDIPGNAIALK